MQRFEVKRPGESVQLTFEFALGLDTGETLTGTPTVAITTWLGTDASPTNVQNGAAAIDVTNTKVVVPVKAGTDKVEYRIEVTCATSNPKKVLSVPAILPVRAN